MGSSNIVILSGLFIMIGMYSLSFHSADRNDFQTTVAQSQHNQAVMLAKAGLKMAIVDLNDSKTYYSTWYSRYYFYDYSGHAVYLPYENDAKLGLWNFTYNISYLNASQLKIISTGTVTSQVDETRNDPNPNIISFTDTLISVVEYASTRWNIERTYIKTDPRFFAVNLLRSN